VPTLAVALLLCAILALGLPAGRAAAEPIVKGRTHISIGRSLMRKLAVDGVSLVKLREAKVQGRVVSLPIDGGEVELSSGSGKVEHEGGFRLLAAGHPVSVTALRLDTGKRGLWGKLDGRSTKFASFAGYRVKRVGFGDAIGVAGLRLRSAVAAELDAKLHRPRLFVPEQPFASLSTSFRPQFDTVASGAMQIALDPRTLAKLDAVGVAPLPFEAQIEASEPPTYAASLTGGTIYPDLRGGSATVEAGIRLERESPRAVVSWLGMSLSLETNQLAADASLSSGAGNSPRGTAPIAALDLSGATARVDRRRREVTLTGVRATLEPAAASLLNEAFAKAPGRPVVAAGDPLGEVSLWITGR
jgi:hypothetical protein